jgi:hypothetical protein
VANSDTDILLFRDVAHHQRRFSFIDSADEAAADLSDSACANTFVRRLCRLDHQLLFFFWGVHQHDRANAACIIFAMMLTSNCNTSCQGNARCNDPAHSASVEICVEQVVLDSRALDAPDLAPDDRQQRHFVRRGDALAVLNVDDRVTRSVGGATIGTE